MESAVRFAVEGRFCFTYPWPLSCSDVTFWSCCILALPMEFFRFVELKSHDFITGGSVWLEFVDTETASVNEVALETEVELVLMVLGVMVLMELELVEFVDTETASVNEITLEIAVELVLMVLGIAVVVELELVEFVDTETASVNEVALETEVELVLIGVFVGVLGLFADWFSNRLPVSLEI
jgi:hypothetical protein